VLHEAYPAAPIYASTATDTQMRTDPLGFYPLTRSLPGSDYPPQLTHADHTFAADSTIDVAGESEAGTVYFDPGTGSLFPGDLTGNHVTPACWKGTPAAGSGTSTACRGASRPRGRPTPATGIPPTPAS
jgi:hypothetical protein